VNLTISDGVDLGYHDRMIQIQIHRLKAFPKTTTESSTSNCPSKIIADHHFPLVYIASGVNSESREALKMRSKLRIPPDLNMQKQFSLNESVEI
jgi:hypothetical protein